MATSTIPNPNQMSSADLTVSAYTQQVIYHKRKCAKYNGNRVHLELSCIFNIDIPLNTHIAGVPEGYRPKSEVYLPAMLKSSSAWFSGVIKVNTTGVITQGLSNYLRECVVDGWYDI